MSSTDTDKRNPDAPATEPDAIAVLEAKIAEAKAELEAKVTERAAAEQAQRVTDARAMVATAKTAFDKLVKASKDEGATVEAIREALAPVTEALDALTAHVRPVKSGKRGSGTRHGRVDRRAQLLSAMEARPNDERTHGGWADAVEEDFPETGRPSPGHIANIFIAPSDGEVWSEAIQVKESPMTWKLHRS